MSRNRIFLFALMVLLGCGTDTEIEATLTSLQENIFDVSCTSSDCHSATAAGGLDLREDQAYEQLVNVQALNDPEFLRVAPGNPEASLLYLKLTGDLNNQGSRMPLGGLQLSEEKIEAVRLWIANGAAPSNITSDTSTTDSGATTGSDSGSSSSGSTDTGSSTSGSSGTDSSSSGGGTTGDSGATSGSGSGTSSNDNTGTDTGSSSTASGTSSSGSTGSSSGTTSSSTTGTSSGSSTSTDSGSSTSGTTGSSTTGSDTGTTSSTSTSGSTGTGSSSGTDSGSSTGSDTGFTTGAETGLGTGTDSGSTTGTDSGSTTGTDSGSSTGGSSGTDTGSTTGGDSGAEPAATFSEIQTNIFNSGCTGCHGSSGGLNLNASVAYDNLVNVPGNIDSSIDLVEPNDPDNSLLYIKVTSPGSGQGSRMPRGGAAMSAEDVEMIRSWIADGAPNN